VRRIARLRAVAGELALRHPGGTFLIGNVHDGPRPAVTGERDYHSRIVQLEPRVITIWNAEAPENPVAAIPLGDATITISDRASGAAARLQILVPDAPAPIALSLFRDTGLGARDADELRALVPAAASA
jgi:hypothetical protein